MLADFDKGAPKQIGANGTRGLLSQLAYDRLFEAIQSGAMPPGSRVREAELAERLEMSRTPLRDALQKLEGEGLLRHEAHRGIVISRLDRQMIVQLYTAREWSEAAAAFLAARHASEAEIEMLRHFLKLEREAADNPAEGARINRKLHLTIYDATHNRYLIRQLQSLSAVLALAGNSTRRSPRRVREAGQEHHLIVDAIAARNPEAAEAAARQHIQAAQQMVLSNWLEETPS